LFNNILSIIILLLLFYEDVNLQSYWVSVYDIIIRITIHLN